MGGMGEAQGASREGAEDARPSHAGVPATPAPGWEQGRVRGSPVRRPDEGRGEEEERGGERRSRRRGGGPRETRPGPTASVRPAAAKEAGGRGWEEVELGMRKKGNGQGGGGRNAPWMWGHEPMGRSISLSGGAAATPRAEGARQGEGGRDKRGKQEGVEEEC